MPQRPLRPCAQPGCPALTKDGWCDKHRPKRAEAAERRPTAAERGYGYKWQQASKAYLRSHPLCECDACRKRIVPLPAEVVDHRIPHKGDMRLFWDQANWMAMNKRCHDKKTAREDGGFGRRRR